MPKGGINMRDAYVESLEEMHKDVEKLICALKDTVKRTGTSHGSAWMSIWHGKSVMVMRPLIT